MGVGIYQLDSEGVKMKRIYLVIFPIFIVLGRYAIGRYEFQHEHRVTEIFIIRGLGSSYMDFNLKFFLVIALIAIMLYDWKKNKRLDYFLICAVCAIGIPIEAFIQLTGQRLLQANYLFGMRLPYIFQLPLQVLSEAAFDVVMLLFFADMMLNKKTKKNAIITFSFVTIVWLAFIFSNGIFTPNYGGEVSSRRVISGTGELAAVLISACVVLAFFLTKKSEKYLFSTPNDAERRRGLYLLSLLIIYGAIGTFGMYLAGVRWVEIGVLGSTFHAPPLIEFAGLTYNFVFEYAFAYSLSYVILVGLKLIKSNDH